MRQCEECKIILEDDVRYCPNCGRGPGVVPAGEAQSPELRALLTSANLHRVRQEWDAAIADATAALELDPNDADVASLLATIYEQRGNLDEAVIWYKIALELDPRNAANKARLQRVSLSVLGSTRPRAWTSRPLIIGVGAVVLVLALVVLTLALTGHLTGARRPARSAERPVKEPGQIRTVSTATAGPEGWRVGGLEGRRVRGSGTLPLSDSPTLKPSGSPALQSARTPAEAAIKARIADSEAVRATGAQVDDVIADPRQGLAVVTFSLAASGPVTRARVVGTAGEIARAVFAANAAVKYVTARCVIAPGGAATVQIAFVGDVSRSALDALGGRPTEAQLEGAFTTTWWNPAISR